MVVLKNKFWNHKLLSSAFGVMALSVLLLLGGCGSSSDDAGGKSDALKDWEGSWNSAVAFTDAPEMQPFYDGMAAGREDYTSGGAKAFFEGMSHTSFNAVDVAGNTVVYKDAEGGVKATVSYTPKGVRKQDFNGYPLEWYLFEAKGDPQAAGAYRYLALLKKHQDDPKSFWHFHMRYGKEGFDDLLDKKNAAWWPTILPDTVTLKEFADDLIPEAKEFAKYMPGAMDAWQGKWMSITQLFDEPQMEPVYTKMAKEAKGYTANGAKGFLYEMSETAFGSMTVEGDKVSFMDSKGAAMGTVSYIYKGKHSVPFFGKKASFHLFEAKGTDDKTPVRVEKKVNPAGAFRFLLLFKPEEPSSAESFWHFHARYANKLEDLEDKDEEKWLATIVPADVSLKNFAGTMEKMAPHFGKMIPPVLSEWEGNWKSSWAFHKSPEMAKVYRAIAEAANKLGKNYTEEKVREYYAKMFKVPFDYVRVADGVMEFKNENGEIIAKATYTNDGFAAPHFFALIDGKVEGNEAGTLKVKTIVSTHPHGSGDSMHWHAYFGDKTPAEVKEAYEKDKKIPTFFRADRSVESYVKRYADTVQKRAEGLPKL